MSGIAQGMWTTLKHFFTSLGKPVTVQYPEERLPLSVGFRGLPRLVYDLKTGDARCVACAICANACPVGVIHIDAHRGPDGRKLLDRFDIEAGGCVYCGLCVEACPFDALTMTPGFELAAYNRVDLLWPKERLLVPGTAENDANMHWIMSGVEKQGKTPPSAWPHAAQEAGLLPPDWTFAADTTEAAGEAAAEAEREEQVAATAS
ncbi:MAG TPA: NADH-quinone oxidoreductase subunit I [Chloroflexota bacterium]|jgi:NADH-quinone oxidoreductase subunit I|nr:NADH-quinone oxidoreductase subunit I [Chloroflexota bacterium]